MNNRKRQLWSEGNMQEALKEVLGKKSSVDIPQRTLRDHVKIMSDRQLRTVDSSTAVNLQFKKSKLGRGTILTEAQETELVNRLFRLAGVGFPLTPKELRKSVFLFCKEKNIETPFKEDNGSAGRKWFNLFLKRHPEVRRRKAQNLNEARAAKLNRFIVHDYFSKLEG